jgi:hypothetical protein
MGKILFQIDGTSPHPWVVFAPDKQQSLKYGCLQLRKRESKGYAMDSCPRDITEKVFWPISGKKAMPGLNELK